MIPIKSIITYKMSIYQQHIDKIKSPSFEKMGPEKPPFPKVIKEHLKNKRKKHVKWRPVQHDLLIPSQVGDLCDELE